MVCDSVGMKTTILILVLLSPTISLAQVGCIGADSTDCSWATEDYVLQISAVTLQVTDWMQTSHAMKNQADTIQENNPLLGQQPSRGRLTIYFLGCISGHTVIAMVLPKPYRTIWQSFWIGVQTRQIGRNIQVVGGLRLSFP
jgi:hypothetical protein